MKDKQFKIARKKKKYSYTLLIGVSTCKMFLILRNPQ